jgi:hypothetical protein
MAKPKVRISIDVDPELFNEIEKKRKKYSMLKSQYIKDLIVYDLMYSDINPRKRFLNNLSTSRQR